MNGQQQKRQWGVTNPISEAQPSDADLKLNDQLVEELKRQNNFESPEGTENRIKVLKHIQTVVDEFARRACRAKNLPASVAENAGGKIFTFGSYSLGVYGPSSDIDTLLCGPKHITMDDFFNFFPPTFRELSDAKDITEFTEVREAYVPIIKMEYRGISIDLIYCCLVSLPSITPTLDLTDKQLLRGLDDTAMRSINGTRVTAELLGAVPQVKPFRHALRAIKMWSTQRAIYGAVFGYPGGVAWAIMVARICQLYPFACGATILTKFFNLMLQWHWPRPVMLKTIEEGTMKLRVWNPSVYQQDRAHLMPIITPAFPSMCATHTIMHSTKSIMMDEFQRAHELLISISSGKKPWADLFERHTFFTHDHKYYLRVIAASRTKKASDVFSGLVQSKVRLLVKGIDDSEAHVKIARPYVKAFDDVHRCETEDEIDQIKQGNLNFRISEEEATAVEEIVAEGGDDTTKTRHMIYTTTFYIGLTLDEEAKSLDISYPVTEFKRWVTMSESYDEENMSVSVVHTRNHQLPDSVFLPGETRPMKPAKEKKKKAKRTFAETGLDDSEHATAKRRELSTINGVASTPTPAPA